LTLESVETKNLVENISKQNNEPRWLLDKRLSAYSLFKEKPMPNFIYGLNINLTIDLNLDDIEVEKTGKAKREIICSNKDIIIEDFDGFLKNHETLFKEKFMTKCVPAVDKFTAFHHAFFNNALLVYVPKNLELKETIELITNVDSKVFFDHLIVVLEDNSNITLVEDLKSKGEGYVSKIVEIFVGNNAKLDYGNLQMLDKQTFNYTKKRAVTGKDAKINWLDCCFGSKVTISEITTNLDKEGAETNNFGIFFGNAEQQFDLVVNSIHNAPNTFSDIFTKGALTDKSKCIYRGLVKISKEAFGSNGYQQQDTLLLSPDAVADSIPDLEIDNSDVKCSHGATIGRIDREKMFYLKSRGLSEKLATQTYVKGFFEQLIIKMKIEKLRENMHDLVEERMR